MDRRDDPAAVERAHRQQVEEVDEEPEEGERLQVLRVVGEAGEVDHGGSGRAQQRAGDADPRLAPGVLRHLLQRDQRAEERDEHRRRDGQPLVPCLDHVPHLVDEQEHDEPDPEPPAADPDVDRGRDEHREQELELEQDDAELGEERADRDDRGPELAREALPTRLGVDRLVVAKVGLELRPGRELAHELIVAAEEPVAGCRPVCGTESLSRRQGVTRYRKDRSHDHRLPALPAQKYDCAACAVPRSRRNDLRGLDRTHRKEHRRVAASRERLAGDEGFEQEGSSGAEGQQRPARLSAKALKGPRAPPAHRASRGSKARPERQSRTRPCSRGGTIDTSAGTQAKNLADANISHPAIGIYCFGDLSFTPQSALVSAGNLSVTAAAIVTVGLDERPTPNLIGCVVGVSRVRVRVHDAAGAALDAPFTIWFQ